MTPLITHTTPVFGFVAPNGDEARSLGDDRMRDMVDAVEAVFLAERGVWVAATLVGGSVSADASGYTPSSRLEHNSVVRLKGRIKNNVDVVPDALDPWLTFGPAQFHPSKEIIIPSRSGGTDIFIHISTAGVLSLNTPLAANSIVYLDGLTYSVS